MEEMFQQLNHEVLGVDDENETDTSKVHCAIYRLKNLKGRFIQIHDEPTGMTFSTKGSSMPGMGVGNFWFMILLKGLSNFDMFPTKL